MSSSSHFSFFTFWSCFLVKVTKKRKIQLSFSGKMRIFYTENTQTGQLIFLILVTLTKNKKTENQMNRTYIAKNHYLMIQPYDKTVQLILVRLVHFNFLRSKKGQLGKQRTIFCLPSSIILGKTKRCWIVLFGIQQLVKLWKLLPKTREFQTF